MMNSPRKERSGACQNFGDSVNQQVCITVNPVIPAIGFKHTFFSQRSTESTQIAIDRSHKWIFRGTTLLLRQEATSIPPGGRETRFKFGVLFESVLKVEGVFVVVNAFGFSTSVSTVDE